MPASAYGAAAGVFVGAVVDGEGVAVGCPNPVRNVRLSFPDSFRFCARACVLRTCVPPRGI